MKARVEIIKSVIYFLRISTVARNYFTSCEDHVETKNLHLELSFIERPRNRTNEHETTTIDCTGISHSITIINTAQTQQDGKKEKDQESFDAVESRCDYDA
eukprot:scaffold39452_cov40-Attheya_sp.AAC.1